MLVGGARQQMIKQLKAELKKLAAAVPFQPFLIETVGCGRCERRLGPNQSYADNRPALVYNIKTGEHKNI